MTEALKGGAVGRDERHSEWVFWSKIDEYTCNPYSMETRPILFSIDHLDSTQIASDA